MTEPQPTEPQPTGRRRRTCGAAARSSPGPRACPAAVFSPGWRPPPARPSPPRCSGTRSGRRPSPARRGNNVLVVISLRGGVDGMGMVVPHGDPAYYTARPSIGIPATSLFAADAMFGLHPSTAAAGVAVDRRRARRGAGRRHGGAQPLPLPGDGGDRGRRPDLERAARLGQPDGRARRRHPAVRRGGPRRPGHADRPRRAGAVADRGGPAGRGAGGRRRRLPETPPAAAAHHLEAVARPPRRRHPGRAEDRQGPATRRASPGTGPTSPIPRPTRPPASPPRSRTPPG